MTNERGTVLVTSAALILMLSGCMRGRGEIRGEEILEYGTPAEYLTCARAAAVARPDTQVIGPEGGRLRAGNSEMTIPANAVREPRRFVFTPTGDTVGVRISAGGPMRFDGNRSARLIIDVSHCDSDELESEDGWWVWRVNERPGRSQKLGTTMTPVRAITQIDSTSGFMIAN